MRLLFTLFVSVGLLCAHSAVAFERKVTGTVTHVSDGDTYWLQLQDGAKLKIRMMRIDAPEICQRGGEAARNALKKRIWRKLVEVELLRKDAFGRWLANTRFNGADIAAAQVRDGYAWADTYRGSWGLYSAEEEEARKAQRGVWATQADQALAERPRDFRYSHGTCFVPTPTPTPTPSAVMASQVKSKAAAKSAAGQSSMVKPLVPLNR